MDSGTGLQPSDHQVDHREPDPGLATLAGLFVVFGEPAILRQPAEGAFNDPTMRLHHESLGIVRTLDDLQNPASKGGHPGDELPCVSAVGPDEPQPRERTPQFREHPFGAVSVLDPSTVDHYRQDQPERIDDQVALAPFNVLAFVVAVGPPFCAVFTDWLSRIAADGVGSRPACSRTRTRKASCTTSTTPAPRHRQKCSQTSAWGGKSCGK